jgi:16S rRNA (uracil1498-N3)-methyltransferase
LRLPSSIFDISIPLLLSVDARPIITFNANTRNPKFADLRDVPIIPAVLRRIHVSAITVGEILLDAIQARHARDVLRLEPGTSVEVFDDAGNLAKGELVISGKKFAVRIAASGVADSSATDFTWIIAAAVPKGERADWMIEKLSELGTGEFIPLAAARSVVLPEGTQKRERWARIATESAKQSRRRGVMRIGKLTTVAELLDSNRDERSQSIWYFSTAADALPISEIGRTLPPASSILALIGPEGGWTDEELQQFSKAGFTAVRLTDTVLRVETAAITAAAVIASVIARRTEIPPA